MTSDEFEDDPWLDGYETVPDRLRRALQVLHRDSRFRILCSLAAEMGLPVNRASHASWHVLYKLYQLLGKALEEETPFWDARFVAIAKDAVAELDLCDAARALSEFGWEAASVPKTTVGQLASVLRVRLSDRLAPKLQRTMQQWEVRGLFG